MGERGSGAGRATEWAPAARPGSRGHPPPRGGLCPPTPPGSVPRARVSLFPLPARLCPPRPRVSVPYARLALSPDLAWLCPPSPPGSAPRARGAPGRSRPERCPEHSGKLSDLRPISRGGKTVFTKSRSLQLIRLQADRGFEGRFLGLSVRALTSVGRGPSVRRGLRSGITYGHFVGHMHVKMLGAPSIRN